MVVTRRMSNSHDSDSVEELPASPDDSPILSTRTKATKKRVTLSSAHEAKFYHTSESEDEATHVQRDMDNFEVQDITLEFFYKPHSLTLLACSLSVLFVACWYRSDEDELANQSKGFLTLSCFFVLGLSVLVFPNGPFIRPHPAVWRMVFGASVLYLCGLVYGVCLNKRQIQFFLNYYDDQIDFNKTDDKVYASDCWSVSWEHISHRLDVFVLAHFLGYVSKAVMLRSHALLWTISITWEVTEMLFMHVLPNFEECLWDQIILDVLLCNGLGIVIGMWICKKLEMRTYDWESIKYINTPTGKMKRALLQFTPASWTRVRWFPTGHGSKSYIFTRIRLVFQILLLCQVNELNCFCLKHIFRLPTEHPFTIGRLVLTGLCVCPTVRQYYTFTTDSRCKRLGTQCWVFIAITAVEMFACARFGWDEIFARLEPVFVLYWLLAQIVASVCCVYFMILHSKYHANKPPPPRFKVKSR